MGLLSEHIEHVTTAHSAVNDAAEEARLAREAAEAAALIAATKQGEHEQRRQEAEGMLRDLGNNALSAGYAEVARTWKEEDENNDVHARIETIALPLSETQVTGFERACIVRIAAGNDLEDVSDLVSNAGENGEYAALGVMMVLSSELAYEENTPSAVEAKARAAARLYGLNTAETARFVASVMDAEREEYLATESARALAIEHAQNVLNGEFQEAQVEPIAIDLESLDHDIAIRGGEEMALSSEERQTENIFVIVRESVARRQQEAVAREDNAQQVAQLEEDNTYLREQNEGLATQLEASQREVASLKLQLTAAQTPQQVESIVSAPSEEALGVASAEDEVDETGEGSSRRSPNFVILTDEIPTDPEETT